ncbi:MAG: ribonuclease R [Eubacteriales bacterium]|nr:ribonuclease R [Eubacteriales bacterium]
MDIKETILKKLSSYDKKVGFDELISGLSQDPADLRHAVGELIGEGKVLSSKKGKLFLPGVFGLYTGRIEVKRMGFAFLLDDEGDIFISADNKKGAMHGDMVAVRLLSSAESDRKREGEVVSIIEEIQRLIVGEVSGKFVIPDDERLDDLYIPQKKLNGAKGGQKVVVTLTKRAQSGQSAEGKVVEILGKAGVSSVEMQSYIRRFGLPESFPEDVEYEARTASERKTNLKNREDFRKQSIYTIDGESAKDLDDAVSVKKLKAGYELGVHIADVTHYVAEGTALDKEAFKRGTSVYLADRVIPMLPEPLSNGACSLTEGKERLALSCIMDIDENGKIQKSRIVESVIRSRHRMTYTDVNTIFEGKDKKLIKKYKDIHGDLLEMKKLAELLRRRREEKGSIDFELEETAFEYDEHGGVIDVRPRQRGDAEKLIEEFMLAANRAVAETYFWRKIPFVYRVHEQPDDEKIKVFAAFYANFGHIKGRVDNIHPKVLQNILKDIKGLPHENIVNQIMLRSLKKAEYSAGCKGHFGLSFSYYCHFTSPIRRYPDLAVHRIIKHDIGGTLTPRYLGTLEEKVDDIARNSSLRERAAMEAERAVDDMKKAEYMKGKEGKTYDGIVSGVLKNVIFVELDNTVEGVIPLSSLQDDYYVYYEKLYCVIGERTRRKVSLGDEMRIRVKSVSVYPPRIEFEPA